MLSISTSWMPEPEKGITHWLEQIKKIGFTAVELSYKVDHEQLKEAEEVLDELELQVSSIHNFCPTPNDEPSDRHVSNYFRLSALDEHERKQAVKWTKIAIDTAKRVRAKVVVIHAGVVDEEDNRSPQLFKLYTNGRVASKQFENERKRILTLRRERKLFYLRSLEQSLEDVLDYAEEHEVTIGLETRYYPLEMPDFDEIRYFLTRFQDKPIGYWHDVGHAEMNSRLGIRAHKDFLETYKKQLIGVHIHGMKGRRDHLAPFEGDMNLKKLLPYFHKDVIRVVESKPFASYDEIKSIVAKLS